MIDTKHKKTAEHHPHEEKKDVHHKDSMHKTVENSDTAHTQDGQENRIITKEYMTSLLVKALQDAKLDINIDLNTDLKNNNQIDSLTRVEINMALEEKLKEFGMAAIPDQIIEKASTFAELIELITDHINSRS